MVASFLIDPTVIWHDFEGPGLPKSRKIEQKLLLFFCCFSNDKKYAQDRFLWISGSILGLVLEPRAAIKMQIGSSFFVLFLEGAILNSGSVFLSKTMCFTRVFFRI